MSNSVLHLRLTGDSTPEFATFNPANSKGLDSMSSSRGYESPRTSSPFRRAIIRLPCS